MSAKPLADFGTEKVKIKQSVYHCAVDSTDRKYEYLNIDYLKYILFEMEGAKITEFYPLLYVLQGEDVTTQNRWGETVRFWMTEREAVAYRIKKFTPIEQPSVTAGLTIDQLMG